MWNRKSERLVELLYQKGRPVDEQDKNLYFLLQSILKKGKIHFSLLLGNAADVSNCFEL